MSRTLVKRCTAQGLFAQSSIRAPIQPLRCFSQSAARCDDSQPPSRPNRPQPAGRPAPKAESLLESIYGTPQGFKRDSNDNPMSHLANSSLFKDVEASKLNMSALDEPQKEVVQRDDDLEPYHLHIHSHKHNTHVTCTKPNREPIISMSAGNIGYRKSRRGLYDSAYSLTKYVLDRLVHTGWPTKMRRVELVLRGYGQGRDAAIKVLMSPEGKIMRDKIVRVADSTRLKFGGTRSKRPRRL